MAEQQQVQESQDTKPKEDMIKVQLKGESVWAARLTPTTAEIRNTPLDERVNFKDIVRISDSGGMHQFVEVIERKYEKAFINYDFNNDTIKEEYPKMCKYLRDNEILIEGYVAGAAGIDYPKELSQDDLRKILSGCPMNIREIEFA